MLQTNYLHENFDLIETRGWALVDLPHEFCHKLLSTAQEKFKSNLFKSALVTSSLTSEKPRTDQTLWIETATPQGYEKDLISLLTSVQNNLTDFFRFKLTHFECHYAVYEPGRYYQRHSDQTKTNNQRYFSFVIYLNESWKPEDGGQLIAYEKNQILFQVEPQFGKMILFKSNIEHEVTLAHRRRWSVTGWFRQ